MNKHSAAVTDINRGASPPLDPERWRTVYRQDGVIILRNSRARPRAWLVAEAEAVDGEEAFRRIRGESERPFDPRRTALLEVRPDELPALPGGEPPQESAARIAEYGADRLTVETDSPAAAVLVVSEMFYPGWEATVDGQAARIHLTNYLLRGVALPPGRHRVEMRYAAPAAATGAIISLVTLLALLALAAGHMRAVRSRQQRADSLRRPRDDGA